MNLKCTCLAEHLYDSSLGITAHNRIIDYDDSLSLNNFAKRIELKANT